MTLTNYRLCDKCGGKAFYDAGLNNDSDALSNDYALDNLGDWAFLCRTCAKTHKCVIVPMDAVPACGVPTWTMLTTTPYYA